MPSAGRVVAQVMPPPGFLEPVAVEAQRAAVLGHVADQFFGRPAGQPGPDFERDFGGGDGGRRPGPQGPNPVGWPGWQRGSVCRHTGEPARRPDRSRTAPATKATMPAMGLKMMVCGRDTSIWKNPTSATRSRVKNVTL